jgi:hypothetical protein
MNRINEKVKEYDHRNMKKEHLEDDRENDREYHGGDNEDLDHGGKQFVDTETFNVGSYAQRLCYDDLRNMVNGHLFAALNGWDLTALVTIRLDRSPQFRRQDWTEWQGRLLDKMSRWLLRQDIETVPAFVWVKEAGAKHVTHMHLLVHLPDVLKQHAALAAFLHQTGGFIDDEPGQRAVVISFGLFGMMNAKMQSGSLIYLLKGIDPNATWCGQNIAQSLGIKPHRNARPVVGRLFGLSHSIGPTARKQAGWKEMRDLQALRLYLHPR